MYVPEGFVFMVGCTCTYIYVGVPAAKILQGYEVLSVVIFSYWINLGRA